MIPVFRPSIGEEEIAAVADVLRSGWIGLGPTVGRFEEAFAAAVGVGHAIGTNSATAALHLSCVAAGLGKGDEALVPALSFVSTAHAVEYTGARAVFVDVDPYTLNLDLEDARRKITKATRAILPVHFGGRPCDLRALRSLAADHDLALIEDAAHACGSSSAGRTIGADPSPYCCFSFQAVKNLTTGEGGMITTDDAQLAKRLRELRWMGISRDTWDRTTDAAAYAWQYWVKELGFKAHLSDIAAAIGLVQLKRLPELNARRAEIAARYTAGLSGIGGLTLPPSVPEGDLHSWHIYHLRTRHRDDLIAHLKRFEINPGVHYYPLHLHPYYAGRDLLGSCPVSEEVWKEVLTLPLYPDLTDAEVDRVIAALHSFGPTMAWRVPRLEGEGVVLREVESSDLDRMRQWRNHQDSAKWFFTRGEITEEMQSAWFNRYLEDQSDILYVIESPEGRALGTLGLNGIDREQGVAEIGRVLIGEVSERNRGWGRRAVRLLIAHAFSVLGLHRVWLEVQEENEAARKLYRSCGFEEEGVLKGAWIHEGKRRNKVVMAALRPE